MKARLLACLLLVSGLCLAQGPRWVVLEARGANLRPGQRLDGKLSLSLKDGERATLIAPDGKTLTLRGPFQGTPASVSGPVNNSREALTALLATRDARISAIGVVRAGLDVGTLPDPWLIDAARSGARCLREGRLPVFWRAVAKKQASFSLAPADRTWGVDIPWPVGATTLILPATARVNEQSLVQISLDGEEFPIALHIIPASVTDPLVIAAWMMERGCLQQADALLRDMSGERNR